MANNEVSDVHIGWREWNPTHVCWTYGKATGEMVHEMVMYNGTSQNELDSLFWGNSHLILHHEESSFESSENLLNKNSSSFVLVIIDFLLPSDGTADGSKHEVASSVPRITEDTVAWRDSPIGVQAMYRAVQVNSAIMTTAGIGSINVHKTSKRVNNSNYVDGSLALAVTVLEGSMMRSLDLYVRAVYEPDHVCNTSHSLERFTLEVSLQLDYSSGIR